MAIKNITFDPTSGVPYASNLTIKGGANFEATFNVGFTSAPDGEFDVSLGSTATRTLKPGRYVYNVLVGSGTTIYSIVNGNIMVYAGVSSAP